MCATFFYSAIVYSNLVRLIPMQDMHLKYIYDLACIIVSRLEMLHMGGRLRDKEGNACNSTGTGIPLSTIDREELFLAARCGIIAAKWRKDDFLFQSRAASREAHAARLQSA